MSALFRTPFFIGFFILGFLSGVGLDAYPIIALVFILFSILSRYDDKCDWFWRPIGKDGGKREKRNRARKTKGARTMRQEKKRTLLLCSGYPVDEELYRQLFPNILRRGLLSDQKPYEGMFILVSPLVALEYVMTYTDNVYVSDEHVTNRLEYTHIYQVTRDPRTRRFYARGYREGSTHLAMPPYDSSIYLSDEQSNILLSRLMPKESPGPHIFL